MRPMISASPAPLLPGPHVPVGSVIRSRECARAAAQPAPGHVMRHDREADPGPLGQRVMRRSTSARGAGAGAAGIAVAAGTAAAASVRPARCGSCPAIALSARAHTTATMMASIASSRSRSRRSRARFTARAPGRCCGLYERGRHYDRPGGEFTRYRRPCDPQNPPLVQQAGWPTRAVYVRGRSRRTLTLRPLSDPPRRAAMTFSASAAGTSTSEKRSVI